MKRKTIYLFLLLSLLCFSQASCWSRKELSELAIVLATAVDRTPDGKILLTLQFSEPASMSGDVAGGSTSTPPVQIVSATGDTIFDAERSMASQVSRHIYWGHSIVLIIGEAAARQGVREVVNFFMRSPQPRETMWVFVAPGQAKQLLMADPGLEKTVAQKIGFLARAKTGFSVDLVNFANMLAARGNEPIASRAEILQITGSPTGKTASVVKLTGVAVFKDDQLVGWLNPSETRGLLWLRGEIGKGAVVIPAPGNPDKKYVLDIIRASSKITPEYRNHRLKFSISFTLEGDLRDDQTNVDPGEHQVIQALEAELQKDIRAKVMEALQKAQEEYRSDIFGFGEVFHRTYKHDWRKLRTNWDEVFAEAEFAIEVKAMVRRTGLLTKSATARD